MIRPLTLPLSYSEEERETYRRGVGLFESLNSIPALRRFLPLPFGKGEGRGEGLFRQR